MERKRDDLKDNYDKKKTELDGYRNKYESQKRVFEEKTGKIRKLTKDIFDMKQEN